LSDIKLHHYRGTVLTVAASRLAQSTEIVTQGSQSLTLGLAL